jgi:hypothetical protein
MGPVLQLSVKPRTYTDSCVHMRIGSDSNDINGLVRRVAMEGRIEVRYVPSADTIMRSVILIVVLKIIVIRDMPPNKHL